MSNEVNSMLLEFHKNGMFAEPKKQEKQEAKDVQKLCPEGVCIQTDETPSPKTTCETCEEGYASIRHRCGHHNGALIN